MTVAALVLRSARRRAGLSLRELARRARTSHATLHAYESGAKEPRLETLVRILRAAGFTLEPSLACRPDAGTVPEAKGQELEAVLRLAEEFPARHDRALQAPVFSAQR